MNRREHLFDILAEECCEVGQRASKVNRFGPTEVQPGQPLNNAERVVLESKDIIALLWMLQEEGHIPDFIPTEQEFREKKARVEKYLAYSASIGTLKEEDWVEIPHSANAEHEVVDFGMSSVVG